MLEHEYQGLFVERIESFKRKIKSFGFHFASLDIRQDSRIIYGTLNTVFEVQPRLKPDNFDDLQEHEQLESLLNLRGSIDLSLIRDPIYEDTLKSLIAMKEIQIANGERASHRYIISNCRGALDVARLIALFKICGWGDQDLSVDIVPLFETISDLRASEHSMQALYESVTYREHLKGRSNKQTVMLGFSDGTKDGGYLMAIWAIYTARNP